MFAKKFVFIFNFRTGNFYYVLKYIFQFVNHIDSNTYNYVAGDSAGNRIRNRSSSIYKTSVFTNRLYHTDHHENEQLSSPAINTKQASETHI